MSSQSYTIACTVLRVIPLNRSSYDTLTGRLGYGELGGNLETSDVEIDATFRTFRSVITMVGIHDS